MSLLLDLFPRDSPYLAGLNFMQTSHDLLLPGGISVLVGRCVQTGDQISSQFGTFVLGQGKRFLQQFMGFLGHIQNYIPGCNLVVASRATRNVPIDFSGSFDNPLHLNG